MSFDIKQKRQESEGMENTTIHWQEMESLKGNLLKEGHRDLLYYTVFLFVPPLILKVNFLILHEEVHVCILRLRDFHSGRQKTNGLK